jgi:hypothetical protein
VLGFKVSIASLLYSKECNGCHHFLAEAGGTLFNFNLSARR